jgi:prepilin-type N-terminal cleavage/methylation domain-containing protein
MNHRPLRRVNGFTLIELLTIIAIIGILAAIIIPVTGRVRESARGSTCRSNLRQVTMATLLAANDNRGRFPAMRSFEWDQPGWNVAGGPRYVYLREGLSRYIKNGNRYYEPFRCPTQEARGREGGRKGDFLVQDNNGSPHYRYNAFMAANNPLPNDPARAMLYFETIWSDWPARDWPHRQSGFSISVSYADGHVTTMTEPAYRELVRGAATEGDSEFFQRGWRR